MPQTAMWAKINHTFWPAVLIAVSAISTAGFACVTPFAAFAVAAAYVLPLRSALLCVLGVWLANQLVGFAALGYPWTLDTLLWGLAIGISALVATAFAFVVLNKQGWNRLTSVSASLVVAFVVYEAGLFLVTFGLGGSEAFTPAIVGQFALLNIVWTAALIGVQEVLRQAHIIGMPLAVDGVKLKLRSSQPDPIS